jgi:pyruvate formate lyase activating enzyme
MKEAIFYEKLKGKTVRCYLCAHECRIEDKKFGICAVRENSKGVLYTHAYGGVVVANIDPIEKKPLYHFMPGTKSFSIGVAGCNFKCSFCQNWEISQKGHKEGGLLQEDEFSVQDLVDEAIRCDCQSISYTYTEPTIFFEYAYDTAKLARERSLRNIFVTNGYMSKACLKEASLYLDAANVDLKFFKDSSYRKFCAASLAPVLDSIRLMKDLGIWVEITTLIIPEVNDSEYELGSIADFILSVDENIPWHVSRFHPDYKLNNYPTTPEITLKKAQDIGEKRGLKFVYAGNVLGWGNDTFCPTCRKLLIKRDSFRVLEYNIKDGKCIYCRNHIPGEFPG